MYIKQSIYVLSIAALLTGCGGGGSSSVPSETTSSLETSNNTTQDASNNTTQTDPGSSAPAAKLTAIHSGQVKDSATGTGIAGVTVSIGSVTTVTDEQGYYTLPSLEASEDAVVTFEKEGYLEGSRHIQLKASSNENNPSNYLEYSMYTYKYQWDYNSSEEIEGAHIMIDASVSYSDLHGSLYTGTINASLVYFDITTDQGKAAFPGQFQGIDSNGETVQFDTYGLINFEVKDSSGNPLSLAEGETATLRFDKVSSLEKPDTLPLWYYDYEQGVWFEEGYARLQEDGTYKGEISHFGTWSVNRPLEEEAGIYRGRIISEDGSPMDNVRLQAIGTNWVSSDLSTDENGVFEIQVIPGSTFRLTAYDYKNKFGASYNGIIAAIASGDVVDDRI